jgi:hypothetical protein
MNSGSKFRMTDAQEMHLELIKERIALLLDHKYRTGQQAAGDDLWTKPALPAAIEEVVDLVAYIVTLTDQHAAIKGHLQAARKHPQDADQFIAAALKILE